MTTARCPTSTSARRPSAATSRIRNARGEYSPVQTWSRSTDTAPSSAVTNLRRSSASGSTSSQVRAASSARDSVCSGAG
ncbi:hypothetical protein ACFQZ4_48415 [Catellatospora coxensis]